jgi:hypothetical protein
MQRNICSLPICFTIKNEISNNDDRFINVTIDVLHTGLNFNGSIFNKDVVDTNIDTIKNTPILGFICSLPDGENDFKGHEYIITKTDQDGIVRKYIGSAYGLIPESCNPRWITKICDDGNEREFLQVDGLLWTKFSDSTDIMLRDIEKPHSMELYPNNIDGYDDNDGNFVFTKFDFDGCCILGSDIQPAMINSNVEVQFATKDFTMVDFVNKLQSELNDKLNIFTNLVNEKSNQGGTEVMQNTDFTQTVLEQFSDISDMVRQFEVMVDRWGDNVPRFYLQDIQDNEVIVVDRKDNYHYYGYQFTMNGDKAEIDFTNGNRKKLRYENYEDGATIHENSFDFGKHIADIEEFAFTKVNDANIKVEVAEQDKATAETNYNNVKADYDEMKPKYNAYVLADEQRQAAELDAQKDAKFAEYEDILVDNADFTALKERKDELSVDEIEKECAVLYVKVNRAKANFSKVNGTSMVVGVIEEEDANEGIVHTKYGNIPVKR